MSSYGFVSLCCLYLVWLYLMCLFVYDCYAVLVFNYGFSFLCCLHSLYVVILLLLIAYMFKAPAREIGGNHLSNATCLTQASFKSGE